VLKKKNYFHRWTICGPHKDVFMAKYPNDGIPTKLLNYRNVHVFLGTRSAFVKKRQMCPVKQTSNCKCYFGTILISNK
jgi:hypothetical protein